MAGFVVTFVLVFMFRHGDKLTGKHGLGATERDIFLAYRATPLGLMVVVVFAEAADKRSATLGACRVGWEPPYPVGI